MDADLQGRFKFYLSLLRSGRATINDIRRLEGLPPIADGDVLFVAVERR